MKKLVALILAAAMLFSCALAETVEEPVDEMAVQIGVYDITNETGEVVTFLSIADNITGESESVTYPAEEGIENGGSIVLSYAIPANEDGNHRLTFSFKTASGYEGTFTTLSIEETGITLLAADAMTGATPIAFTEAPQSQDGYYLIRNATGATVTELTLIDNVTGASISFVPENGLKDGDEMDICFSIPANEDGTHRLSLHFTIETGENSYTGLSFTTLSIEEATIELLNPDATSGATPIRFVVGE
ncbi:MAG: hypothetical protein IKO00_11310 [Oscillospiraceae bacterium]|nr:hypothetical protein [Oscillospiraceae bacterium]